VLVLSLRLGQGGIVGTFVDLQVDVLVRLAVVFLEEFTVVVENSVLRVVFGGFGGTCPCARRAFGFGELVDGALSGHDHFFGVLHCTLDSVHDDEGDVRGRIRLSSSLLDLVRAADWYVERCYGADWDCRLCSDTLAVILIHSFVQLTASSRYPSKHFLAKLATGNATTAYFVT
jgi:hypothetical protein